MCFGTHWHGTVSGHRRSGSQFVLRLGPFAPMPVAVRQQILQNRCQRVPMYRKSGSTGISKKRVLL